MLIGPITLVFSGRINHGTELNTETGFEADQVWARGAPVILAHKLSQKVSGWWGSSAAKDQVREKFVSRFNALTSAMASVFIYIINKRPGLYSAFHPLG